MPESNLEFSDYALRRMQARGITDHHVWYCIVHHDDSEQYCITDKNKRILVWTCKLPDGRNIKIHIIDGSRNPIYVIDAFSFQ